MTTTDYRREFPDFSPTVYLNCAYQGPFPRKTVERIKFATELKCHPERLEERDYFDLPDGIRARLARLTGADPNEIALSNSATQGIGIVAAGLDFRPGDEVVVAGTNFPSNLFTWLHLRRLGVNVRVVRPRDGLLRPEDVSAALTSRTRVLALDWVNYTTGVRIDLAEFGEMAHTRGGIFVVDGTQGVGALALDLHAVPVDVLAVAAYKWLLGPYDAGFAYLNPRAQGLVEPQIVNWFSLQGSEHFDELPAEVSIDQINLRRAARIFDVPGTANFLNLHALDASLEFVECAGIETVERHCRYLIDCLIDGLKHRGLILSAAAREPHRSTIQGFQAESLEATARIYERLKEEHISVSLRRGMIRVSPYLYNDESDVLRLVSALDGR